MTATFQKTTSSPHRVCPTCGELLVSSRCPECTPPEPARSYSDRATQQIGGPGLTASASSAGASRMAIANAVDVRRATGEWVTGPDEREPQTRRAHPTLVRTALAEAEERARDKIERSALVTRVQAQTKPRHGQTAQRLRPVTPLPPPPQDVEVEAVSNTARGLVRPVPAPSNETQPVDPRDFIVSAPVAEIEAPVHAPIAFVDTAPVSDEDGNDNRARIFWFALLGGAAVVLALAAI